LSVVIVMGRTPEVGMPSLAGVPTSLRSVLLSALCGVHAQMSSAAGSTGAERSKTPPIQATPATISRTAAPAPMPAMIRRRRRSLPARRAICRSSFSRASFRCRSLLAVTECFPSYLLAVPHVRHATRPQECTGTS
jgi:hypothetical protein